MLVDSKSIYSEWILQVLDRIGFTQSKIHLHFGVTSLFRNLAFGMFLHSGRSQSRG
jgi:hypothetical protein